MNIEEVAEETPEAIIAEPIDIATGKKWNNGEGEGGVNLTVGWCCRTLTQGEDSYNTCQMTWGIGRPNCKTTY